MPEIATAIVLTVILALGLRWSCQFRHDQRLGLHQLILPVLTLVLYDFGYVTRMTRRRWPR